MLGVVLLMVGDESAEGVREGGETTDARRETKGTPSSALTNPSPDAVPRGRQSLDHVTRTL